MMKQFLLILFSILIFNICFGQSEKESHNDSIKKKTYVSNKSIKTNRNGKEITSTSKGKKETKLEKVILLSNDDVLNKNTSIEDVSLIVEKTNIIFNSLFKNSKKSGKIIIQFEIRKINNLIQFAVKDNLDLDIMKEFEIKVNEEIYPNSKKEPVKIQLIYKVNSFNEIE